VIRILIIAREKNKLKGLTARLSREGYTFSIIPSAEQVIEEEMPKPPDLLLADAERMAEIRQAVELFPKTGAAKTPLLAVIIPVELINSIVNEDGIDDFVVKPFNIDELYIRVKRLIRRIKSVDLRKVIKRGDLVIDTSSCEVTFTGRLVELTFREYELLRFLATNRGQVFSREALLNKVWKYDYLGGERTVDVHIRRLRSKIEDAEHTYIDTVRNIGYRFRKGA